MDEASLRRLEFDKIMRQLGALTAFAPARRRCDRLRPSRRPAVVARRLAEAEEARRLLDADPELAMTGPDIAPLLVRLRRQGTLTAAQAADLLIFLTEQQRFARRLRESDVPFKALAPHVQAIRLCSELRETLARTVMPDGAVLDQASATLADLRRRIKQLNDDVREVLERMVQPLWRRGLLQEPIVTQRDGRFVLPVKAAFRSQVKGVVTELSGSGQTAFVEPAAVAALNRRLQALQLESEQEVQRILAAVSREAAAVEPALRQTLAAVAYLEFTLARARWGKRHHAVTPILQSEPRLAFEAARHPLLGDGAVPLDVTLGDAFDLLIITGPNTGGKTVALKTIGLLAALAQAGLQVPAAGAELGVFDAIFADIGDEQSIEQNLSTFSAHVTHLRDIIGQATDASLILLDELGAGTDPEEGAALALAVLDELRERGSKVVVTTHFVPLKTYAYEHPRAENASVEFDERSLQPTYRLLIGVPGRSHALTIAARRGLPPALIDAARRYLQAGMTRVDTALAEIEEQRRLLERDRQGLHEQRLQLEQARAEVERLRERLQEQRERLQTRFATELQLRFNRLYAEAEAALAELRRQRKSADPRAAEQVGERTRRQIRQLRQQGRRALQEALAGDAAQPEAEGAPPPVESSVPAAPAGDESGWRPGMRVWVPALGQAGEVLQADAAAGKLLVQVGAMKVQLDAGDVRRRPADASDAPSPKARKGPAAAHGVTRPAQRTTDAMLQLRKEKHVPAELHLRGLPSDEALYRLEKYLDDALLVGLTQVTIVHGKGEGILRRAIHAALRENPRVASFRLGGPREGSYGVTIVQLHRPDA